MNVRWLGAVVIFLTACSTSSASYQGTAAASWWLGFLAPDYMEVWVEAAGVRDTEGGVFPRSGGGTVAISYSRDPAGWPTRPGRGAGIDVLGADLPAEIYVRWQSLVEPQTYEVTLEIPEPVRDLMRQREPMPRHLPERRLSPRNHVVVGLAPGGIVKVWNSGHGLEPQAVMCIQATVVAAGPDQGRHEGRYVTLPEAARAYVESNPIPYESWTCDES